MSVPLESYRYEPLTKAVFESGKIVSLRSMLRLHADIFIQHALLLDHLAEAFNSHDDRMSPEVKTRMTSVLQSIGQSFKSYSRTLTAAKLLMSSREAERLVKCLTEPNSSIPADRIKASARQLSIRLIEELQDRELFVLPPGRIGYYRKRGSILGPKIIREIPEIKEDAMQAGNCFAFANYTACAFHLMRVMEHVVHLFADDVGVIFDSERDSWGQILDRVPAKIDAWRRGSVKQKYSACYRRLDGMRSWRNEIMHHEAHYSEDRAQDLISTVRLCLSEFLRLPQVPQETGEQGQG
jgi:hypothetical protein